MATNEELALLLQQGDKTAAAPLWEQVRGWCFRVVSGYRPIAEANRAIDPEDLMQCAFLGMLEAAKTYDPDKGAFLTWLSFYVRKSSREALGLIGRTKREHYAAVSMEAPIGEDLCIADTLEAESVPDALEAEDLQQDVCAAVDALPEHQQEILHMHYWEGATIAEISRQTGRSAHAERNKALNELRRNKVLKADYMPDYLHWGLSTFKHTWTSSTEAAVLWAVTREGI